MEPHVVLSTPMLGYPSVCGLQINEGQVEVQAIPYRVVILTRIFGPYGLHLAAAEHEAAQKYEGNAPNKGPARTTSVTHENVQKEILPARK